MTLPFDSIAPVLGIVGTLAVAGWIYTTWLRIKHGYPLEGTWGNPVYPKTSGETVERVKLLSGENAQLRAELAAIKDRLATIERIVTDGSFRLDREIDALRGPSN